MEIEIKMLMLENMKYEENLVIYTQNFYTLCTLYDTFFKIRFKMIPPDIYPA